MVTERSFYEGCGKEGPIRCILLCEFHPTLGPKIACQVPADYISKDVFESVSVYIIPKPQLVKNMLTITLSGLKIVGFPMKIDNNEYARNSYCFNVCFVFDGWSRTAQYESVVKKLTEYLTAMEHHNRFLSRCMDSKDYNVKFLNMLNQVMSDLNTHKVCELSEGKYSTYLKVLPTASNTQTVMDHHVPVFVESLESFLPDQWDLTTQQILSYINGVNHVSKISANADVDSSLVKSCLQNLLYYKIINIVPVFQYSNMYSTTDKLRKLSTDKNLQNECINAVSRNNKELPWMKDIFLLYSNMRHGITIRDLCIRYKPMDMNIDERNLVQFGILQGIIRRIYKYPVIFGAEDVNVPYSQYFTGEFSTDEICCLTGLSSQQLEDQIEDNANVIMVFK